MKAMRGRIALPKHFVKNRRMSLLLFRGALGVRTRPRVPFLNARKPIGHLTSRSAMHQETLSNL